MLQTPHGNPGVAAALAGLDTPAALLDLARMQRNIARMQQRMDGHGVAFRPHVKTTKCIEIVRAQLAAGARGITVSTLKEAEQFFAAGIDDILYAVSMASAKLPRALALQRSGCRLKLVVDNRAAAHAIVAFGQAQGAVFEVWIEVDTDAHRGGLKPHEDDLLAVGKLLHDGGMHVGGVMTHAGSSYELHTAAALAALAEQERAGCVHAAQRLRAAGLPCAGVSVGSTPTALSAADLAGVTEVRAGVYVLFDLVMCNTGVCSVDELALSVLTTVIGHQLHKGWIIVDAGWMAMSRDRGTARQAHDYGYGLACDLDGRPLAGYVLTAANQEHGILSAPAALGEAEGAALAARFALGTKLRILPNHACATGAQFPAYHALSETGELAQWHRFYGW
jgi:D-serine deaminase-like pyridoxal phosphate-dependent protein